MARILAEFIDQTPWLPRVHPKGREVAFAHEMVEKSWVWVYKRTEISGFISRHQDTIHCLYVDRTSHGQGFGSALLRHAMERRDALNLWTFQANLAARMFYRRHGFHEGACSDGATTDERLPDVQLAWSKPL